jgi:hypothetical protein
MARLLDRDRRDLHRHGAQGYDLSLTRYAEGWRSTFIRRNHATRPWVGQVLSFHPTPWRAVQHAAWKVLDAD